MRLGGGSHGDARTARPGRSSASPHRPRSRRSRGSRASQDVRRTARRAPSARTSSTTTSTRSSTRSTTCSRPTPRSSSAASSRRAASEPVTEPHRRRGRCPPPSLTPGTLLVRRLPGDVRARPAARRVAPCRQGTPVDRRRTARRSSRRRSPAACVMAGDRRATMGNIIAQRDIEKVFPADEYSCVGIAGTAGLAVELVRLFQVELEHYEKIEGTHALPRRQGQPARHPDPRQPRHGHAGPRRRAAVRRLRPRRRARAGSSPTTSPAAATRSTAFHSVGSGSLFARGALKKLYRDGPRRRASASTALRRRRCTTPPTTTPPPVVPT